MVSQNNGPIFSQYSGSQSITTDNRAGAGLAVCVFTLPDGWPSPKSRSATIAMRREANEIEGCQIRSWQIPSGFTHYLQGIGRR